MCVVENGPTENPYSIYLYNPPLNTWIHAALVYDPSVPAMKYYLNGSLIALDDIGGQLISHTFTL